MYATYTLQTNLLHITEGLMETNNFNPCIRQRTALLTAPLLLPSPLYCNLFRDYDSISVLIITQDLYTSLRL